MDCMTQPPARRLEPYEMAEFVSPWQGFGGAAILSPDV
ncbi:MAG: hypothetical protein JWP89_2525 [Schlesneria sp.]|nr:hypothetical protein [Schlesneria sp.]